MIFIIPGKGALGKVIANGTTHKMKLSVQIAMKLETVDTLVNVFSLSMRIILLDMKLSSSKTGLVYNAPNTVAF